MDIAHQALLSMGFSRQEYRSGLLCPPPEVLPDPGIGPASLMSLELAGRFFTTSTTDAGDLASVPGLGRSSGEGKGYLLQYSGLDHPWGRKELDTTEQLSLSYF